MRNGEKIALGLIFGLIGIHVLAQVVIPTINSQIAEMRPIPMVTVTPENTTAKRPSEDPTPTTSATVERSMVIPERPSAAQVLQWSLGDLRFALFVTFSGIGIFLPWVGVVMGQFPENPSVQAPLLFFWLSSMASVPIVLFQFSRRIPWWRLAVYLYLLPVLIGGMGIVYFTNFGA